MGQRVGLRSKLKPVRRRRSESESETGARLAIDDQLRGSDPKPGDLAMGRLKVG